MYSTLETSFFKKSFSSYSVLRISLVRSTRHSTPFPRAFACQEHCRFCSANNSSKHHVFEIIDQHLLWATSVNLVISLYSVYHGLHNCNMHTLICCLDMVLGNSSQVLGRAGPPETKGSPTKTNPQQRNFCGLLLSPFQHGVCFLPL